MHHYKHEMFILKTIIHLHVPIKYTSAANVYVSSRPSRHVSLADNSKMAYPTTHNWCNIILLINTCTKLSAYIN